MHLDLNLLTALDALLEEGGVASAAHRLHLSQPAMSRTLGRIRTATGDPILVRAGRTMIPTPRALALRAEVHALVLRARAVLAPQRGLDLHKLTRTFTVRCHDAMLAALGSSMLTTLRSSAPGVRLRLLGETAADTPDLRHGQVDMEIGSARSTHPEIRSEVIGHDHLVAVVRPEHPCARGGRLTVRRYAQAHHLIISRRGRFRDPIDALLEARGLRREVVASFAAGASALQAVRQSDLMVTLAERMCQPAVQALGLRALAIPLPLQPVPVVMVWHQRDDDDQAHTWLRGEVGRTLRTICQSGAFQGLTFGA